MSQEREVPSIDVARRDRRAGAQGGESPITPERQPVSRPWGFWGFMRTLFLGGGSIAVLGVVATLAANLWMTANQRDEAEKQRPWANPSFTTTAVTTGGMLGRWTDNDGNLANGHSYINGIYALWKVRFPEEFEKLLHVEGAMAMARVTGTAQSRIEPGIGLQESSLPLLWAIELNADVEQRVRKEVLVREAMDQSLRSSAAAAEVAMAKRAAEEWHKKCVQRGDCPTPKK